MGDIAVKHSINVEIAAKFGVDIAVIMDLFIHCNYANKKDEHGIRWIEFDEHDLYEYFSYFTPQKIKFLLKECVSLNLLTSHPDKDFCYSLTGGTK